MRFGMMIGALAVSAGLAACTDVSTGGGYVSDGYNRNVLIVNQTGRTIWRFYGSNVGTSSWEEDILGSSVLSSGQSVNIDFTDGTGHCNFDFRIEFQDGSYVEDYNINVCAVGTYYVQ